MYFQQVSSGQTIDVRVNISTVFFILAHSTADVLFSVEEIVVEKGSSVFSKGIFNRSTNSSTDLTTVKFVRYGL